AIRPLWGCLYRGLRRRSRKPKSSRLPQGCFPPSWPERLSRVRVPRTRRASLRLRSTKGRWAILWTASALFAAARKPAETIRAARRPNRNFVGIAERDCATSSIFRHREHRVFCSLYSVFSVLSVVKKDNRIALPKLGLNLTF